MLLLKMFFLELSRTSVVCIDHLFAEFLTSDAFSPDYVQAKEERIHFVSFFRSFVHFNNFGYITVKKSVVIFYAWLKQCMCLSGCQE